MPLENLTGSNVFITNLVPSNPAGTDPVSEGDNHIAGTKNVLLNSFPAINGAVTATPAQLNQLAHAGGAELTDVPKAPTAAAGTSTTQLATTEFVTVAADAVADAAVGTGQTWQDLTASRVGVTAYQNTTGRPIQLSISGRGTAANPTPKMQVSADNVTWISIGEFPRSDEQSRYAQHNPIIPDTWWYRVDIAINNYIWAELR